MARNRWKVNLKPIWNMLNNLDTNIEEAAEAIAKKGGEPVREDFEKFFSKGEKSKWSGHHVTGLTKEAIQEEMTNIQGKMSYKVGFNWKEPHGLVPIFFERGSPTITPKIKILTKARNDKRIVPAMEKETEKWLRKQGFKIK